MSSPNPAYGYIVGAAIAKGRITAMDLAAAKAAPGVLGDRDAENAGKLGKGRRNTASCSAARRSQHYHQAIAHRRRRDVRAGARCGAARRVDVRARARRIRSRRREELGDVPPNDRAVPESAVGDFDDGLRGCARAARRDLHHARPIARDDGAARYHGAWDGDKLTVWTSNQMVDRGAARPREDARHSEGEHADHLAVHRRRLRRQAVPAFGRGAGRARRARAGRPVKVALQRPLIFNNTTHRPATIQRIRIGAAPDGKITAIAHESWSGNLPGGKPGDAVAPDADALCGREPHDGDCGSPSLDLPEGNCDARAGRGAGPDGARDRDGRDGGEARDRPDRISHPERYPGRSGEAATRPFSQRQLGRMPARLGARAFRLGASATRRRARRARATG